MAKERMSISLDAFDQAACFEFWYGADYQQVCQRLKCPTARQRLFLMSLISNLHLPLKKYGVTFPYEDTEHHQYLLKPKKRFLTLNDYHDVQALIDTLKELPRQFEVYQKAPCLTNYFALEATLKKLLIYFSIPQEKLFFETLKKRVSATQWKAYRLEEEKKALAAQASHLIQEWKEEQVAYLKGTCQPLTLDEETLRICLSRFKKQHDEGTRFISLNQKEKLIQLYYESLAWLLLLNDSKTIKPASHSDHYFDFLTFKEAGFLIEALEHLNQQFSSKATVQNQQPFIITLSPNTCVSKELIELLTIFSECLPHFKPLSNTLTVQCFEFTTDITPTRLMKTRAFVQSLALKLSNTSEIEGFYGFEGFSCSSHEFYFALEIQNYLIQQSKQEELSLAAELSFDDLITFISQCEMMKEVEIEMDLAHQSDDWSFLVTGELEGNIVTYFKTMKEQLATDLEKQDQKQLLLEEMQYLLETLPMFPATL